MHDSLLLQTRDPAIVSRMTTALTERGLDVLRSFDLNAPATLPAGFGVQCIVLLVYGTAPDPVTIVAAGSGGEMQIRLGVSGWGIGADLEADVRAILVEMAV